MEGGAAKAAAEAAAEPPTEPRPSRAEASPQTGAREAQIGRRVWSALPTSRAAPLAEEIVVVVDALAPSRLQFHLAITSRIDLIL
jgi:hypothetical protein